MMDNNNLGCGKRFKQLVGRLKKTNRGYDFICGVADGWGKETLCFKCDIKLRKQWVEEDLKVKKYLKGGINNNDN